MKCGGHRRAAGISLEVSRKTCVAKQALASSISPLFQVQIGACCCLLLLPTHPSIFEYWLQPPCPKENDSTGLDTLSLGSSSTMCISFVVTTSGIFSFSVGFKFYQCKGRVWFTIGSSCPLHNAAIVWNQILVTLAAIIFPFLPQTFPQA